MINFDKKTVPEILEIVEIIEELRATRSINEKMAILERNKDNKELQTILELTYNPFKKYKITEKSLKEKDTNGYTYRNLMDLTSGLSMSGLSDMTGIDDMTRNMVSDFILRTDEEIRDLYRCVILKDLRIGINASTINKVWNGLIPSSETGVEIKPMLASKFDFEKPPKGEFIVTEKLDGIRCIAICKEETVELYTRQGKLIKGCLEIEEDLMEIREYLGYDIVFDGELLAKDCDYSSVYKETTKRVKNKKEIKTGIKYVMFDSIDLIEFVSKRCYTDALSRYSRLIKLNEKGVNELSSVDVLEPLYIGDNTENLLVLLEEYKSKGAEGLMVSMCDGFYDFKRSKNLLKVKVMQTADLRIVGFEEGQGRNEGKLGALLVDFKGNTVGVGSGFTDFDREYIWNNQHLYLGRVVEVSYFEISKNKDGKESLRFPVFKEIREFGKEVSYH